MLCLTDSIRHDDPSVPCLVSAVEEAVTLTELLVAAWQLARVLVIHIVEDVLAARACRPTRWPACPACGRFVRSKGFAQRQVTSLFGPLQWHRRVGRCPQGCAIEQVVPFDDFSPRLKPGVSWVRTTQETPNALPTPLAP